MGLSGTVDSEAASAYLRRVTGLEPAQFARWARRQGLVPAGAVRIGRSTTLLWSAAAVMQLAEDLRADDHFDGADHAWHAECRRSIYAHSAVEQLGSSSAS